MMKKLLLTFVAVVSLVACATSVEKTEITFGQSQKGAKWSGGKPRE
jgi:hypothetical protein